MSGIKSSTIRTIELGEQARQQQVDFFQGSLSYVKDLVSLTKPKIMVLLLISTTCPMILASGGAVSIETVLYALVGGALISGSASCVNCIWDTDIDALMTRTKNRAIPTGRVGVFPAILWSALLGWAGYYILNTFLNPLAGFIALCGHLFYSIVYTMWLKRSTAQNIVIGGAAGAVPPLVGWAAVAGELDTTAWLLFLVIFIWTPPHFWALALNKNEDYKRARVPMLPTVAGEKETHRQMLIYAVALIPISWFLVSSSPLLGVFSAVSLTALGVVFAYKVLKLGNLVDEEQKTIQAWDVFKFSVFYLAFFFAALVVDSTVI